MRRSYLFLAVCYLLAIILFGCGGGAGAPGSQGTEDTGVEFAASVTGLYNGADTYSVDAFRDICDPGPPPTVEIFTDHQATLSITARLLNPGTSTPAGNLTVEYYTIEFKRSDDSIGAPPIEFDKRDDVIQIPAPTGAGTTQVTTSILLVDLIRKMKYADDIESGKYSSFGASLNNYTAIYTFYGHNEFGKAFSFKTQLSFQIGNFDNC